MLALGTIRLWARFRRAVSGGDVEAYEREEDGRLTSAREIGVFAPECRPCILRHCNASPVDCRCGTVHHAQRQPPHERAAAGCMCHNECRMGEDCPCAHVISIDPSQTTPFVRRTLRHVKAVSEGFSTGATSAVGLSSSSSFSQPMKTFLWGVSPKIVPHGDKKPLPIDFECQDRDPSSSVSSQQFLVSPLDTTSRSSSMNDRKRLGN